jgi:hypothetical protein
MSSADIIDTLKFATEQLNIYWGLFILITGIFGQICNIIVFTTLKTFRETTCGFYLTIVSIANLGQSLPIVMRILTGFSINLSGSSILCKFRWFLSQYFALVSLTSMCLTTIDQFLSMTNYRHLNNMRMAHRHIAFTWIFWFIHGIFTFIYYDSYQNACIITNPIFAKYFSYFFVLILFGFLPLTIMSIFSLLAFFKIRATVSREINNVRLSRDRQLTAMTLFHVVCAVITIIPLAIFSAYTISITVTDPQEIALNLLISTITTLFCYGGFSVSFFLSIKIENQ